MKHIIFYIYGILSYVLFLGVFIYTICFLGNFAVPKTIDSGTTGALFPSLIADTGLITIFALQHSLMARQGFKKRWTKIIPKPIERSTYVLLSSFILILLIFLWQPLPETVWSVDFLPAEILLWTLFAFGWIFLFISTKLINDKHLFGLQQVKQNYKGHKLSDPKFQTPAFYKFTRHPMMLGFLIAFWATPEMSWGHLIFALTFTIYIGVGIQLEERDMLNFFGKQYREYRKKVPMIIPVKALFNAKQTSHNLVRGNAIEKD